MDFKAFYQQKLAAKNYQADASQLHGCELIAKVYTEWLNLDLSLSLSLVTKAKNIIHGLKTYILKYAPNLKLDNHNANINANNIKQGIYLWGGVGRGKSFLMDTFYQYVCTYYKPHAHKNCIGRLHFHEFMRDIHKQLEKLRGNANPIDHVAKHIAEQYHILCFDEFHVNDIADAMIFDRLFHALFKYGIFIVLTSNYHADNLYLNGLHRERFLPAIDLLKKQLCIENVDGGQDYRLQTLQQIHMYHTPLTANTQNVLMDIFERLSTVNAADLPITQLNQAAQTNYIQIENRRIDVQLKRHNVVWFDFMSICHGPRSQNDYLEIAMQFNTVIISDIPYMPPNMSSTARRFTWLVDIFYDYKVKLIISAAVEPYSLYTEGVLANEFQRTVSRLIEMQSIEYLNLQHK
jgi:cell division protein ZapE